jgi:protein tyrosine phosphatase (PTP) superfamily phosphohydrolase (DUF442 family)
METIEAITPKTSIRRLRVWLFWVMCLLLIGVAWKAVDVMFLTNRHTVIPGKIYRSSQPSGANVRDEARQKGIKTILNLRGLSNEFDWYQQECDACRDLGISQEDITLSANSLPPPAEIRRIVEVFDRTEYPILIHCKAGADRTGLVSAMALLLMTDATLDEARKQLLPRFGHFRFGRTAAMDEFYDQYTLYLQSRSETHSREGFRHWLLNEYCPGPARSTLELVEKSPLKFPAGSAFAFQVKATNRSNTAWELKPGIYAGVHASYRVYNEKREPFVDTRTGFRFETVPPGGSTIFALPVIALPPGRYLLIVELHNATGAGISFRTNSFVKFGDESLSAEFTVE